MDLSKVIREIPDFPQEGVLFRDITTLLKDPAALKDAVDQICDQLKDLEFDYVLGPESRGFIFGVPVAYAMNKGFIPVRKPGKLPCAVIRKEYDLEYGSNVLEIHADALKKGDTDLDDYDYGEDEDEMEFESYQEASGETQDNAVENDAPPDSEDSQ